MAFPLQSPKPIIVVNVCLGDNQTVKNLLTITTTPEKGAFASTLIDLNIPLLAGISQQNNELFINDSICLPFAVFILYPK